MVIKVPGCKYCVDCSVMEAIINSKMEELEDFYGLLGCDELSTTEQITSEFKVKALACHPDKHPENPNAVQEFQKLQEAKDVLADENKRKKYDLWLRSRITVPFSKWQALGDTAKISMHWTIRTKKKPMLEAATDTTEIYNGDYKLCRTSDSPSSLLLKFRNYEI
ncbi:dnaJ homolog subfamily C member 12 [Trichomycterus rosablanca]|uniref:dnaJ homolog subfamily C member 12 n=1 Tax=Trichomycterus rosablanca TaxID=2290929 RepID=UPI002F356027